MTKKDLRIVYMGTPEFAVESLRALVEGGYNVVAVVTMPDKPAGRGHQVQYSAVKQYALQAGLPLLQPEKLKDPTFLEQLQAYQADLQIVVAFRMLPEVVWAMPRLGTFNLHAALLPQYRGAAPLNWAVINGDKETGATTFMLRHEIDTGNIILQERMPIGDNENVGSVHDRLMLLGKDLVIKTVDLIIDCDTRGIPVPTTPQPETGNLRPAPKIFKETCEIHFADKTAQEVHNFVRGLSPYPAAWCNLTIHGKLYENVKVYEVQPLTNQEAAPYVSQTDNAPCVSQTDNASSSSSKDILVPCREGYVRILSLQLPGKKRMDAKALLNGLHNA